MKKLIAIAAVLLLTLSSLGLYAQPQQQQQRPKPNNQNRGDFTQFQLQVLTKQLRLSEDKVESFTKLYTEYSKKMEALNPKPQKREEATEQGKTTDTEANKRPTTGEVEAQILESFDMAEKSTALKREYYYKFKEILTPQKILKMYNIERRLRERIISESDRRSDENQQGGMKR